MGENVIDKSVEGRLVQGRPKSLSIVVPCYNEEDGIAELIRRCRQSASDVAGDDYEIVLVDDGSSDGTWGAISLETERGRNVVGMRLSRNFGEEVALMAGLSAASGELVLVLDADLQDPPELLAPMVEVMKREGADVVYGQRRTRAGESWFKTKSASIFCRFLKQVSSLSIPVDAGEFRLMTRRVVKLIAQMPERDRFIRGMVAYVGFKQVPFLYDRDRRFSGETKYPVSKLVRLAIDAFLSYSLGLTRLSWASAAFLIVAIIAVSVYSLHAWLYLEVLPGWTSLMISLLVVSFFQLVSLSIISEYIGRIYLGTKGRPLFIVDQVKRSS
ncbi:glycosyltransferase family 2 protein [Bradyrhizobium archetypum]|uniref:Glycosyltransferase family 2 protein n=1 Tax=Bradyrhizobium archetypum TaxID=2721160 RepID=A0A7Y4HB05_9BRAD|nr:glycosyltransferase family 2 protein [Bradyrhizobium archetypum]NOJ50920.1 glycosyltransferase family 2 protein [Bradyrhizobium archetypum]